MVAGMKKIVSVLLALCLLCGLYACGGPKEVENEEVTVAEKKGLFTGTLENGAPNGEGKVVFTDGEKGEWSFEGTFTEGVPEKGKLDSLPLVLKINGKDVSGVYSGDAQGFTASGEGKFTADSEEAPFSYEGEFSDGTLSGAGDVENYPFALGYDGETYEGTYNGGFTDGLPDGDGKFAYKDEDNHYFEYEGGWKAGGLSGEGKLKSDLLVVHFKENDRQGTYEGETLDGVPSGTGSFTAVNDEDVTYTYTGEWKDGLWNGQGVKKNDASNYPTHTGTFTDGEFTPTAAEWFATLGTYETSKFSVSDASRQFITEHEQNFRNHTLEGIEDLVNPTYSYLEFSKNSTGYESTPIKVEGLRVNQIEEHEDWWGNVRTLILAWDMERDNYYWVEMMGKVPDIYESNTITLYALPLDHFTFKSAINTEVWAVACAGLSVSK